MAHQVLEQRELARAQIEGDAGALDTAREQVQDEVADDQPRGLGSGSRAADQRLHACQQLCESKWLDEVVVTAGLQTAHAIVHGATRAQDQHRRAHVPRAHGLDDREPVAAWQHEVDDGDVVLGGQRRA